MCSCRAGVLCCSAIPGHFKNINLLPSSDGKLESELNLGTLLVQYFFLSHIFFTVYFHYPPPKIQFLSFS